MTRQQRAENANRLLAVIAGCGRGFFKHNEIVSKFDVDVRGRVWFIDAYRQRRIYTHYNGNWRSFSEGGTMRRLVERIRDYIASGKPQQLGLGPFPDWMNGGDPWAYGDDMQRVRDAARELRISQ